jgi:hypothetical protein
LSCYFEPSLLKTVDLNQLFIYWNQTKILSCYLEPSLLLHLSLRQLFKDWNQTKILLCYLEPSLLKTVDLDQFFIYFTEVAATSSLRTEPDRESWREENG